MNGEVFCDAFCVAGLGERVVRRPRGANPNGEVALIDVQAGLGRLLQGVQQG